MSLSARFEARDRHDHLLGADASMEKGVAIPGLVLAKLRGIHKEVVLERNQVRHAEPTGRKTQMSLVARHVRSVPLLGSQILPELVAQVAGGVLTGEYSRRMLAKDGAVIGREDHFVAASRCLPKDVERRRAFEPCTSQVPKSGLVPSDLHEDR